MAELEIIRHLNASQDRVFAYITKPEHLLQWWGPEGMTLPEHNLDFTALGPWFSTMQNADGQQFKVSGQVTHIDPPNSVSFTWAWHDNTDQRGAESHVTLSLSAHDDGTTTLKLHHKQLADADAATNHEAGWTSAFRKLEQLAN